MEPLKLSELSLEQKIGQVLSVHFIKGEEDKKFIYNLIKNHALGGISVDFYEGCEKEIAEINELAGYPILIAQDMECGFPLCSVKTPAPMSLGAANDPNLAYEYAKATAIQAKKAGFNTIWGPVVDFAPQDALCRVQRCLGSDAKKVTELACEMIRAYQEQGVQCTAKHFPGVSDLTSDSHMISESSNQTVEDLFKYDLVPYVEAIKKVELQGVMIGHHFCRNIDPLYPATLSKKIISILRDTCGFKGLIYSDSLAMTGLNQQFGEKNVAAMAIAAGNDIVITSWREDCKTTYDNLLSAYKQGLFTENDLNRAVSNVLAAQERIMQQATQIELTDEQINALKSLSQRCVCAVTEDGISATLDEKTSKLFIILTENIYKDDKGDTVEISFSNYCNPSKLKKLIHDNYPDAAIYEINEFPNQQQVDQACHRASLYDEVIIMSFCIGKSALASDGLTKRVINIMHAIQENTAAVVHIGNPYAMEEIPHEKRIIFGFSSGNCEEAVFDVLKGRMEPTGKLPVNLKLK